MQCNYCSYTAPRRTSAAPCAFGITCAARARTGESEEFIQVKERLLAQRDTFEVKKAKRTAEAEVDAAVEVEVEAEQKVKAEGDGKQATVKKMFDTKASDDIDDLIGHRRVLLSTGATSSPPSLSIRQLTYIPSQRATR